MEQIVFPVPNICKYLTEESKVRVFTTTERDDQGSKVNDFFQQFDNLYNEMRWQKKIRSKCALSVPHAWKITTVAQKLAAGLSSWVSGCCYFWKLQWFRVCWLGVNFLLLLSPLLCLCREQGPVLVFTSHFSLGEHLLLPGVFAQHRCGRVLPVWWWWRWRWDVM